jgi:hypothetical protein
MTCPSCGTIANDADAERCRRCGARLARPDRQPDFPLPVLRAPTRRGEAAQRAAGIVPQVLAKPKAAPAPAPSPAGVTAPAGPPEPVQGWTAPAATGGWMPPDPAAGRPGPTPGVPRPVPAPPPDPRLGPTYNVGVAAGAGARTDRGGAAPDRATGPGGSERDLPSEAAARERAGRLGKPVFAVPPPPPSPHRGSPPASPSHALDTQVPSLQRPPLAAVAPPAHSSLGPTDPTLVSPALTPDTTVPVPVVGADLDRHSEVAPDEVTRREERGHDRDEVRPRLDVPWPPPPGSWSGRRSTTES